MSLRNFLIQINQTFKVIVLTETWLTNESFNCDYNYQLTGYKSIHFERKTGKKGGGICAFVHDSLSFKVREDLSVSNNDNEILFLEIENKRKKNGLLGVIYRPLSGNIIKFNSILTKMLNVMNRENKHVFLTGDFNIDSLTYDTNTNVQNVFNTLFSGGFIPIINKPTRVTPSSSTIIDHVFLNCFLNENTTSGIIQTDISDHFPIFFTTKTINCNTLKDKSTIIHKRMFNDQTIRDFTQTLQNTDWTDVINAKDANKSYEAFLKIYSHHYNYFFPLKKITIKNKNIPSPWMSKGLIKSSKLKQKLYKAAQIEVK